MGVVRQLVGVEQLNRIAALVRSVRQIRWKPSSMNEEGGALIADMGGGVESVETAAVMRDAVSA